MMYSPQTSNQPLSWPQILTVALLAIGAVAVRWEIQPDRPEPSGQGVSTRGIQSIDARLWQDPFGPISKADQTSNHTPYTLSELKTLVRNPDAKVRVIAALVSGGKWVRADEARRRARYAILSGLQVESYVPYDPEHIGHARDDVLHTKLDIPYEWLEYNPDKTDPGKAKPDLLLVLWIDEDALLINADSRLREFSEQNGPLARLNAIRSKFITDDEQFSFSVIGPSSSTLLTATNEKADERLKQSPEKTTPWYSPLATIPDVNFAKFLQQAGKWNFDFERLITSDEHLAEALAGELRLRGIGGEDGIALIAQRDTAYSRELLQQMRKYLGRNGKKTDTENTNLIELGYLRGIDGRLPGGDAKDRKKETDKSSAKKEGDGDSMERPEGDAQIDYLRRMVAELKHRQSDKTPIKAIGIFGNDYYDKLILIKALRPAFPQAVFFTTDLDAAMLHPKDNHHLRNLVVASGYGLSLNPGLQRDAPPFRDSYQTATFLAARLSVSAAEPAAAPKFPPPQIFEIGRSAILPLTGPKEVDRCTRPEECGTLQLPLAIPSWAAALLLPALMATLLLAAFANGSIKREHVVPWLAALAVTAAASCGLIYVLRADPAISEPLSLLQGTSIWPSAMLRFLAALLAILLILRGHKLLAENQELIRIRFHLSPSTESKSVPDADKSKGAVPACLRPPPRCCKIIRKLFGLKASSGTTADAEEAASREKTFLCQPDRGQSSGKQFPAVDIWRSYTDRDENILPAYLRVRCLWTTGGFIAFMTLSGLLFAWLFPGPPPNIPARGELAFIVHRVVLFAALFSFWALLFFCLDQTLRANCLAKLHAGQTLWPAGTYKAFWPIESGETPEQKVFTDWLDARLIAHATEPIQRIVFYPFLVLALLVLARSNLFDSWNMPAVLYVMFGIPVLLMIGAAWPLRARAEKVRETALRWLHVRLMEEQAAGDEQLVKQIKSMIEQVEHLKTGAFAPFSERPLFKGVLTLVGTLSGVALMDYAHLIGL